MFHFRLEKLRGYRALLEEQAERTYLERKAFRIATEQEIVAIRERRHSFGLRTVTSVPDRLDMQGHYTKADDDETAAKCALAVLQDEEVAAGPDVEGEDAHRRQIPWNVTETSVIWLACARESRRRTLP